MRKIIFLFLIVFTVSTASSQTADLYSWKQNNTVTGYNGILADVQQVFYSASYVYVKATGIPSYTIGPWAMNPNTPVNQNWTFKITRNPVNNPSPTTVGGGQIGVLVNGVVLFNAGDAMSYNNQNIWHRIAYYFEGTGFDTSGGHPAPGGAYHYHINMKKLYTATSSQHSPLLGYMFDGYPVYGAYGFANTNGTGGIRRIKSSYRKRNITQRTTLPDGTALPTNQYGPAINTQYPLGCFVEDYEYVAGYGDLDQHNGRVNVTPEYPSGIYTYYATIDSLGNPEYPYTVGPTYKGIVVAGNTGPGGGHVTITETVTQFFPTGIENINEELGFNLYQNYPNPFNPETNIKFEISRSGFTTLKVYDMVGKEIAVLINEKLSAGGYAVKFNGTNFTSGVYFYKIENNGKSEVKKMILMK